MTRPRTVPRPEGVGQSLGQPGFDFEGEFPRHEEVALVDHHFDLAAAAYRQLARHGVGRRYMSPEMLIYWGNALEHHLIELRQLLDKGEAPPDWSRHPGVEDYYAGRFGAMRVRR